MQESFLVRLPKGDDLLEAITRVFQEKSIRKASFQVIGAVDRAVLAFYDTVERQYKNQDFPEPLEIVACLGNVSERDGEIFVHAHATLAGKDFRCVGGHLMPGTPIFAAELFAVPVPGEVLVRRFDEPTGLTLWS
jgi:uncharacterized protein